jgi:autotransporter translocation and assembly factor TamB
MEGEMFVEGSNPPLVTGDLTIVSMAYLVNFVEENQGSPIMIALSSENMWDLDLNIDILSNYWIKNDDIDAELSGNMNLRRERGGYRFFGEMNLLRGSAFLADKTFRIQPESRVIYNGEEDLNAQLDITACTQISGYRPTNTGTEEYEVPERLDICVLVTGTIEAPEINPTAESDIPLTKEELVPLLLANYYGSGDVTADGRLEERVSGVIGSQLSQIGSKRLSKLGVETFEVDPYYEGQFDPLRTRVTVGFYTHPSVYVYGRSALSLQSGRQAGVEFRLSKNVMVDGRSDEDQLYRLGLKLHWEF